jgi:arginase
MGVTYGEHVKEPAMPRRFALIDAPSPRGAGPTGVERRGEALRTAGLKGVLNAEDGGAERVPAHDPRRDPGTLLLNPVAIRDLSQRLADVLGSVLDRGRFPVVLGGDCNILIGKMLAVRRRGRYGLFFLDGHTDFYQPEASPTGAVSDMDLAIVTGHGPAVLSDIEGRRRLVREGDVVVFGYRDAEEAVYYGSRDVRDTVMQVYDLAAVRALGAEEAAAQALDRLLGHGEVAGFWIHLEADVLDDAAMPAVDYRLPGGLSAASRPVRCPRAAAADGPAGVSHPRPHAIVDCEPSAVPRFSPPPPWDAPEATAPDAVVISPGPSGQFTCQTGADSSHANNRAAPVDLPAA